MKQEDPGKEYLKAFGKLSKSNKMLEEALERLAGIEKRKTPALDEAFKYLAGHEKRRTPMLDEAYRRLTGKRLRA